MATSIVETSRPRRLLSIDGGGLCGILPAQALVLMEQQLDQLTGNPQPLCNRFDLIGGTSTGAILAAGLALGLKATDLLEFYVKFGPDIFHKVFLLKRFWHKYPSAPIEKHLKDVFGELTTLGDAKLRTNILLVAKNATLGNDWFFTNSPGNKYFPNNKNIPLWHIVRASSAAPTYFPPHAFSVPDESGTPQPYEFIDGGVSSYNNPSLQVFLEATVPEYGIGWPMGVDNLLLISLGTGFSEMPIAAGKAAHYEMFDWAQYVLAELMNEANLQQNVLMSLIGRKPAFTSAGSTSPMNMMAVEAAIAKSAPGTPAPSVVERMSAAMGPRKLLTYQRITVGLTRERLNDLGLPDVDPRKVREMDAVDQIPNMVRLGAAVAKEQVNMGQYGPFFNF